MFNGDRLLKCASAGSLFSLSAAYCQLVFSLHLLILLPSLNKERNLWMVCVTAIRRLSFVQSATYICFFSN